MSLKVSTWNVNGIRARSQQVLEWIASDTPDIVCLQETKARPDQLPALLYGLLCAGIWIAAWLLGRFWRKWPAYIIGLPLFLDHLADDGSEVARRRLQLELVRPDTRDVEQVADQPVLPIDLVPGAFEQLEDSRDLVGHAGRVCAGGQALPPALG